MLKDKYVFAQLVKFLDNDKFRHIVDKYDGDKYVKSYPVRLLAKWHLQHKTASATTYSCCSRRCFLLHLQ